MASMVMNQCLCTRTMPFLTLSLSPHRSLWLVLHPAHTRRAPASESLRRQSILLDVGARSRRQQLAARCLKRLPQGEPHQTAADVNQPALTILSGCMPTYKACK